MPGVVTKSRSRPSSLKKPLSRATSTGRSWTAFMVATCGFLAACGFLVASWTVIAFPPQVNDDLSGAYRPPSAFVTSSAQAVGVAWEQVLDRDRAGDDALVD